MHKYIQKVKMTTEITFAWTL